MIRIDFIIEVIITILQKITSPLFFILVVLMKIIINNDTADKILY